MSASLRRRLQPLLNEEELGNRLPPELLRDSRLDASSPLLRALSLQRLPQNVVVALATAQNNLFLDKLAE